MPASSNPITNQGACGVALVLAALAGWVEAIGLRGSGSVFLFMSGTPLIWRFL